jgi:branched-chain amino acid transport system ATP-binding protein
MSAAFGYASVLEVRGVKKIYATLTALGGIDLTVTERSFHGLIGPNGSGKSTLLKAIAGAETPTEGSVKFLGNDITHATPAERSRAGMSLKFQITSILPALSVYDNVLLAVQAQDSMPALFLSRTREPLHRRIMEMLVQFRLDGRPDELAGDLLAPIRQRCSLLIVEHDLDFIRDICDTLTVLDQGHIVDSGPTQIVQNSDRVKEVYLSHA